MESTSSHKTLQRNKARELSHEKLLPDEQKDIRERAEKVDTHLDVFSDTGCLVMGSNCCLLADVVVFVRDNTFGLFIVLLLLILLLLVFAAAAGVGELLIAFVFVV
jgi:hypothetical protein